jgi:hypothetical protein
MSVEYNRYLNSSFILQGTNKITKPDHNVIKISLYIIHFTAYISLILSKAKEA